MAADIAFNVWPFVPIEPPYLMLRIVTVLVNFGPVPSISPVTIHPEMPYRSGITSWATYNNTLNLTACIGGRFRFRGFSHFRVSLPLFKSLAKQQNQ